MKAIIIEDETAALSSLIMTSNMLCKVQDL